MKKIAFLLSADLQEDGVLNVRMGREAQIMAEMLGDAWECVFLVRSIRGKTYAEMPANIRWIEDDHVPQPFVDELPSRIQSGMVRWRNAPKITEETFDCAIALGFDPWALESVWHRLNAHRKFLYLNRFLRHYIGEADVSFFREMMQAWNGVLCVTQEQAEDAQALLKDVVPVYKTGLPFDIAKLAERVKDEDEDVPFEADEVNIVAVYSPENEEMMESIPTLASELKADRPELRWYILGQGERFGRLQHNIVVLDVWQEVIPLGEVENIYPYISACDACICLENDRYTQWMCAARVMGKKIIHADTLGKEELPIEKADATSQWMQWADAKQFMNIIEGD